MYSIYKIQCAANKQCYIGLTNDIPRRKRHHFSNLKGNKHYNYLLQDEFNLYGAGVFTFEVLEENIQTLKKAKLREIFWIKKYDSYHDGYNLTKGGDYTTPKNKKSCVWNNIEYESITAAATVLGISPSSLRERFQRGYTCDSDIPVKGENQKTKCIWNGIEYSSIQDAAKEIGIHYTTLITRLRKGYTCDNDVKPSRREQMEWNGIIYQNLVEAGKSIGVTGSTMAYYRDMGWNQDADIPRNEQYNSVPCSWNGINYPSIAAAARGAKMAQAQMWHYISKGYRGDIDTPLRSKRIKGD